MRATEAPHEHRISAGSWSVRPEPERNNGRAACTDQSRLPDAGLPSGGRGCRAGGLRALVRDDPATAAGHRIARRLADEGHRPYLPGPARLGPGPARALCGGLAPPAVAGPHGVAVRAEPRRRG